MLHKDYQGYVLQSDKNCEKCSRIDRRIQGRYWTPPRFSTQLISFFHHYRQADGEHQEGCTMDMLFADDIFLSIQNHRELEEDLEICRNALERRGLKASRSKTKYLRVGGVDDGEELKLQGQKVKIAKNFKYLRSTVSIDGRCEEVIRRRIQAGWMSWRKVFGVLCDRKLSAKVKGKCTRVLLDQPCFMEWKRWQCLKDKWEKWKLQS